MRWRANENSSMIEGGRAHGVRGSVRFAARDVRRFLGAALSRCLGDRELRRSSSRLVKSKNVKARGRHTYLSDTLLASSEVAACESKLSY